MEILLLQSDHLLSHKHTSNITNHAPEFILPISRHAKYHPHPIEPFTSFPFYRKNTFAIKNAENIIGFLLTIGTLYHISPHLHGQLVKLLAVLFTNSVSTTAKLQ
jgi:hypothetical protein